MSRAKGRNWIGRHVAAIIAAGAWTILFPAAVAAHPLGNFTINHYAGLRVASDRVELDVVIDEVRWTGQPNAGISVATGIYEVKDGLIRSVRVVRGDAAPAR